MVARILQGHTLSLSLSAVGQIVPPLKHLIGWANVARLCLLDASNKQKCFDSTTQPQCLTLQGNQHANSLLVWSWDRRKSASKNNTQATYAFIFKCTCLSFEKPQIAFPCVLKQLTIQTFMSLQNQWWVRSLRFYITNWCVCWCASFVCVVLVHFHHD